jgi:hypothetical protein
MRRREKKRNNNNKGKEHDYDKWIKMSKKIREEDVARMSQTKDVSETGTSPSSYGSTKKFESRERTAPMKPSVVGEELLSWIESVYETTPKTPKFETTVDDDDDDNDDDDDVVEEEVKKFGRKNFGEIASPYLTPHLYNRRFLDRQYGIRREDGGRFMIGDSTLSVEDASDIFLKGRHFKWTRDLWELLTCKNVDRGFITADDLKRYKTILHMTNVHLQGYEIGRQHSDFTWA